MWRSVRERATSPTPWRPGETPAPCEAPVASPAGATLAQPACRRRGARRLVEAEGLRRDSAGRCAARFAARGGGCKESFARAGAQAELLELQLQAAPRQAEPRCRLGDIA